MSPGPELLPGGDLSLTHPSDSPQEYISDQPQFSPFLKKDA